MAPELTGVKSRSEAKAPFPLTTGQHYPLTPHEGPRSMVACYLLALRKCTSARRPCAPWTAFTSTARTTLASRPSTKQESASTARPWSSKRPRVRPFSSIPQSESCEASKPAVAPPAPRSAVWPWPALHPGTGRGSSPAPEGPWRVDVPNQRVHSGRPSGLGRRLSFDNALNKLPLKKRKLEGLTVPPACETRASRL